MVYGATERKQESRVKECLFCCAPESVAMQVRLPLVLSGLGLLEAMGGVRAGDQGGAV